MKSTFRRLILPSVLAVSATVPALALSVLPPPPTPPPVADVAPADEVTRTGVIERRVAIGGETTGWVLRDGKGKRIDLLLPIAAFATIREGAHVVVRGKVGTRKYPERGEVSVFVVREIHETVN